MVERTGVTIKQMLVRSNNFLTVCKDEDCFLCRTRTRGGGGGGQGGEQHEGQGGRGGAVQDCGRRGILYQTECESCAKAVEQQEAESKEMKKKNKAAKEEEIKEPKEVKKKKKAMRSVYIGESFRCARLRLFEHFRDYRASKATSHMFTHYQEFHGEDEEKPTFRAKVLRYHTNSTQRQLHEATLLWRLSKQNGVSLHLMNQKGMYNRSHLERLGMQESFKESHLMDPGKENDKNGDKVLDEDKTPSSTPTVSDSNLKISNTSKVKKSFNKKTIGQKAKSADISQYFKIKTDNG